MTIITSISDGATVWLGHNNASTMGDTPIPDQNHWIYFGDWCLGISGEGRQQNILEWNIQKLEEQCDTPMAVIHTIGEIFMDKNIYKHSDSWAAPSFKIWCILANKNGNIWDVDCRLSLTKMPLNQIWARGSGIDYALGADFATRAINPEMGHEDRIRIATEAAIYNDVGCPGSAIITKFT